MPKSNFLLVDLNEPKVKKLAETITSETSRKILNHLAEKEDTEQKIAQVLSMPISTVHYHLQKLQEAQLVKVDEFHYSPKGREVNHYKLANKYIIIAPQKVAGLREKLKGILPAGLIILGISGMVKIIQSWSSQEAVYDTSERVAALTMETAAVPIAITPDVALWFGLGGIAALFLYLVIVIIKEKIIK